MFGKRLREVRQAHGLTLEELADKYNAMFDGGLNKGTLSKYENGKQEPMVGTVYNLSIILHVSSDYLLGASDSQVSAPAEREGRPDLIMSNRNGQPVKVVLTDEERELAQKALELIIPDAVKDCPF